MASVRPKDEDAKKKDLVASLAKVNAQAPVAPAPEPPPAVMPEPAPELTPAPSPEASSDGEMSLGQMLAMAAISLGPALLGGALGGKQGAMAGAASGTGAAAGYAGGIAKKAEDERKAKAEKAADWKDFTDKEDYKNKNKPLAKGETKTWTDKKGNKREGVVGKDGRVVMDEATDPIIDPAKPDKPPKDITVAERNTLQSQYDRDPATRKNKHVMDSYVDAVQLAADPSAAADHALIFAYMKALDPGSVVKETEAETTKAFGDLSERAQAKLQEMTNGQKLTTAQRADILKQIRTLAQSAAKKQDMTDAEFQRLAGRRGVSAEDLRFAGRPTFEDAKKKDEPPPSYTPEQQAAAAALLEKRRKEREQAGKKNDGNGG